MTLDQDTLATTEKACEQLWSLKQQAEVAAEKTPEALRAKELLNKWHNMHRKIDAMKLLLADSERETAEDKALA